MLVHGGFRVKVGMMDSGRVKKGSEAAQRGARTEGGEVPEGRGRPSGSFWEAAQRRALPDDSGAAQGRVAAQLQLAHRGQVSRDPDRRLLFCETGRARASPSCRGAVIRCDNACNQARLAMQAFVQGLSPHRHRDVSEAPLCPAGA